MNDDTGRTVLVTGSSRGIGRAVAVALARAGWKVAVHGRSAAGATDVAGQLAATGSHAGTFLADLADRDGAARLAADVTATLGRLDALVLVAGADVLTGEAAKWGYERKLDELLLVDVRATMLLTRDLGRWMAERDGGAIVTIGWDQAATGMEGDSGELFAAAKGAVMAFTRSAAKSLAPKVRVNCVAPGWIRTAWGAGASEAWQRRAVRESMLGRWGEPEDIATAVAWLVSPQAGFVTGQVINVNGGWRPA
ncbi:MAG: SDR family NAD(P)-dependent oxidoreductase [Planctomycetia bacterium]|jgi:3-oxoacyl-[acyl-carrier protein] reductase